MRKIILKMEVSLDGFASGPNGELDWALVGNEESWKYVNDLLSTVDATLIGRVTYQGFGYYWPSVAANPSSTKNEIDFAHWIENIPKIVFSKTLSTVEWKNSRLVKENIAEEVAKMKQQPGKNLVMFGGIGIAQTFTQMGLIDEYRLNVNPVALGSGKPLFKDIKDTINLKLQGTKTFNTGVVGLHYETKRN
jgi:dihydrofolate reductase